MKILQKKITRINSSDEDAETRQQQIELIQSQIQDLELRIQEIEKKLPKNRPTRPSDQTTLLSERALHKLHLQTPCLIFTSNLSNYQHS